MRSLTAFLTLTAAAAAVRVAMRAVSKSRLVFQETESNRAILDRCPLLTQEYQAPPYFWNGHIETLFAALTRRNLGLKYDRKLVPLSDGGVVALDFEPADMNQGLPRDAPVVLILPGLTGGSYDSYVQFAVKAVREIDMRAVVYNPRGLADSPVLTPKLYSASYTGDLREAVMHVKREFPQSRLYAAGFSLGANLLLNYLGEEGKDTLLDAAISLCNPFDLVVSAEAVSSGFSRLYSSRLGKGLATNFAKHRHLFEGLEGGFDLDRAARAATVREYDDALIIHSFGWSSVDEYYEGASSRHRVGNISIPLLAVQAEDDPLALARGIPEEALKSNPNCILAVTPSGGHLGWVQRGDLFGGPWTDGCVQQFFTAIEQLRLPKGGAAAAQPGAVASPETSTRQCRDVSTGV